VLDSNGRKSFIRYIPVCHENAKKQEKFDPTLIRQKVQDWRGGGIHIMQNTGNEPINSGVKRILIDEGLFTIPKSPAEEPHLIGSKCRNCGEVVFPRQRGCPNCCSENVEEIPMGPKGKLYSFTNVNRAVPEGYKGPVPYGVGLVDLPEGARIFAPLTESDPGKLKVGMDLTLIVGKLFEDAEGNEVIGFKFKPL
jgi:uncharacterized protein